ncbi:hypothetical protein Q5H93_23950 [Hymenobacter sp. ASUV-10]|uniref:SH3 domain-containing protein n=1 Tax=Hymenobacter aranciens TaxID=3063996 RepID=A0ABT9BMC8_9BACT|nr:hypothetical protein [Hymenobacter sp. ASUV-10]MDO7877811.1 hypothetical protein [Hymenobacter sp. ASUV-10]
MKLTVLPFLLLLALATRAQVGIGTAAPDPTAALDIAGSGKGLLIPRLDSAQRVRIAAPPTGLMVFQTDGRRGFWYAVDGAWLYIPDKTRSGDNLGNHTATRNLNLADKLLVGGTGTSSGSNGLRVNAAGQVGIGTLAPLDMLHVESVLGTRVQVVSTTPYFAGYVSKSSLHEYFAGVSGNGNDYIIYDNNTASERLRILGTTGNAGFQTEHPHSTLHVNGSFAVGLAMGLVGSPAGTRLGNSPSGYVGLSPEPNADYYLLPAATSCPGRLYYIRNNSPTNAAYLSTVQGYIYEGGSVPNTAGAFVLAASGLTKTITAISDGQNWTVIKNGN